MFWHKLSICRSINETWIDFFNTKNFEYFLISHLMFVVMIKPYTLKPFMNYINSYYTFKDEFKYWNDYWWMMFFMIMFFTNVSFELKVMNMDEFIRNQWHERWISFKQIFRLFSFLIESPNCLIITRVLVKNISILSKMATANTSGAALLALNQTQSVNGFASDADAIAILGSNVNSMFLVIMGTIIIFMQAGFGFLEAGSIRAKNTTNILIKNFADLTFGNF